MLGAKIEELVIMAGHTNYIAIGGYTRCWTVQFSLPRLLDNSNVLSAGTCSG
jgi:hypothetical protein